MKRLKKFLAAALAAAMAFVMLAVPAGAESIADTAKAIKSGKSYSAILPSGGNTADYKITVSKSGTLKLDIVSGMEHSYVYVYDSDGNEVHSIKAEAISGDIGRVGYKSIDCDWNSTIEKFKGSISYSVNKGTYYIRVYRDTSGWRDGGSGDVTLTATFPSSDSSSTSSSPYLTLEVKKGSSVQLGTTISGATWSTSKKSVATVSSSGKVTAKKKGSAIITAKVNGTTIKVKIKVK